MFIIVIALVFLFRLMGYYCLNTFCGDRPYPLIRLVDFPFYMFSLHFRVLIKFFFKTSKEYELERKQILQLEKEKFATELKNLKAQLNPHFSFHT